MEHFINEIVKDILKSKEKINNTQRQNYKIGQMSDEEVGRYFTF